MKIEDLKVGRVYRAKRPRGVHRLDGSYVNDREILYISPFGESIQYDSPSVTFKAKYPIISTFDPSHEKLIEFINRYYTRRGWRIISIVKGNGDFWATLELETEKKND